MKIGRDKDGYVKIKGALVFDMVLADDGQSYVIKPGPEHILGGQRVQDKYQIEVIFKTSEHSNLPQVYEKDDRIKSVSSAKNRRLEDLHINPNGAACLCLNVAEREYLPNGFNLPDFFHNLVIPFFYGQSYFEKNEVWPGDQYSHGVVGLLEGFLEKKDVLKEDVESFIGYLKSRQEWQFIQRVLISKKRVKGHYPCICGSSKKFRSCHKNALHGLWKLRQTIAEFDIKVQ